MGFLSGAVGGQSTFSAAPATGTAVFREQELLPTIKQTQDDYRKQLEMANGIAGNQGALGEQLLAQSRGEGPNIAQKQLEEATNRNIAQNATLIASQRGLNPALAARLIANNAANAGQTAAGQSGIMRAQQQLASEGLAGQVLGQQANTALSGGSLANQNLGIVQGAQTNQNNQIVNARNSANETNATTARTNAAANQAAVGGILNGAGQALHLLAAAKGGEIPGKAIVPGDHTSNDTVPAILSPKEVVLPRSVTMAPDAPDKAKAFMEAIQKHREVKDEPKGFSKVLDSRRRLQEAMEHLKAVHSMMEKANGAA